MRMAHRIHAVWNKRLAIEFLITTATKFDRVRYLKTWFDKASLNQICTNCLSKLISLYIVQQFLYSVLHPSLYFRAFFTSMKGVPRKKKVVRYVCK